MLELCESKCLAILSVKAQWIVPACHTKANKLIKFASGQSLLALLPLETFYYLTWVVCQNYIRFRFPKPDQKLRVAKKILNMWRHELCETW